MLFITTIFIFVSIILYNLALSGLQTAFVLGQRMQNECKHMYTIYNTSNYQLSLVLKDPNGPDKIINIADLILYVVIFLICISVIAEQLNLFNLFGDKNTKPKLSLTLQIPSILAIATILMALSAISPIFITMNDIVNNIGQSSYLNKDTSITYSFYITYGLFVFVFLLNYYFNNTIIKPFTVILLAISFVAVILLTLIKKNKLFYSINTTYKDLTEYEGSSTPPALTIAKYVESICRKDALVNGIKTVSESQFRNVSDLQKLLTPVQTPFASYLMENIKAVPKWNNTTPPDDTELWPFVLNESNGLELNNLYSYADAKSSNADTATQLNSASPSNGAPQAAKNE
jgi:hypothetical protein